jgi:hypothetical protein
MDAGLRRHELKVGDGLVYAPGEEFSCRFFSNENRLPWLASNCREFDFLPKIAINLAMNGVFF